MNEKDSADIALHTIPKVRDELSASLLFASWDRMIIKRTLMKDSIMFAISIMRKDSLRAKYEIVSTKKGIKFWMV